MKNVSFIPILILLIIAIIFFLGFYPMLVNGEEVSPDDNNTTSLKSSSLPYSLTEQYQIGDGSRVGKTNVIEFTDKKFHHCVVVLSNTNSIAISCENH